MGTKEIVKKIFKATVLSILLVFIFIFQLAFLVSLTESLYFLIPVFVLIVPEFFIIKGLSKCKIKNIKNQEAPILNYAESAENKEKIINIYDMPKVSCEIPLEQNKIVNNIVSQESAQSARLQESDYVPSIENDAISQHELQAFINRCNKKPHTKPYEGIESCIAEFTEIDREIEHIKKSGNSIAFFDKNGILTGVFPRNENISLYEDRQVAYMADYFVMNNKIYNLHNPLDVKNLELPKSIFNGDITSDISYIMRMHRGNEDNPKLELAIINKTYELMLNSKWEYAEQDFILLAKCLMKIDRFDKADELYNSAKIYLAKKRAENFAERIQGQDLIQSSFHETTCGICSMYQGRVFSISGKDKRFPKLPDEVLKYQGFHPGCRHGFYPYHYPYVNTIERFVPTESGEPKKIVYDAIEYSNRPFVDERTEEEKARYEEPLHKKDVSTDYEYIKTYYLKRKASLQEYNLIKEYLPEKAPKSYAGYARMKSMNTKNYQILVKDLREKGVSINQGEQST